METRRSVYKIVTGLFSGLHNNANLLPLHAMQALDSIAFSLSGIFIPIFLLSGGRDLRSVVVYLALFNISLVIGAFIAGGIASSIGLKKTLLVRFPFLLAYLLLLVIGEPYKINLVMLAFAGGMQSAFYWSVLNILFARHAESENMGSAVSWLMAVPQIASLVGPVVGGAAILLFGFHSLFYATMALSVASFLPLLFTEKLDFRFEFKPSRGLEFFRKNPRFVFSEIFDNIGGEMEGVIWPIFVYLAYKNIVAVGTVGALLALGSTTFMLVIGNLTDKKQESVFIRTAAPLMVIIWLARSMFPGQNVIFLSTLLSGFVISLLIVPYTRLIFNSAKKKTNYDFYIVKELPMLAGRLILFLAIYVFADNLKLVFPLSGLSYLYFMFL